MQDKATKSAYSMIDMCTYCQRFNQPPDTLPGFGRSWKIARIDRVHIGGAPGAQASAMCIKRRAQLNSPPRSNARRETQIGMSRSSTCAGTRLCNLNTDHLWGDSRWTTGGEP